VTRVKQFSNVPLCYKLTT